MEPAIISYNKNDFIWNSVDGNDNCQLLLRGKYKKHNGTTKSITDGCRRQPSKCSDYNDQLTTCNQFLQNKQYETTIMHAQNSHSGAKERYIDTANNYNMQLLTSFNLGVGIIGIGVFIFYNH